MKDLIEQYLKVSERLNVFENQRRSRIERELTEIKKDKNRHIYYKSLYWRLFNYISAC